MFLGLEPRLAKALLHLYDHSSFKASENFKVTQRDISQLIGASRESVNKQLRSWERRKWLKLKRGGLVILAPDVLRRLIADATL